MQQLKNRGKIAEARKAALLFPERRREPEKNMHARQLEEERQNMTASTTVLLGQDM
jgi:hypothetical protein